MRRKPTPKDRRLAREREAEQLRIEALARIEATRRQEHWPAGALAADQAALAHNHTYSVFPLYYVDRRVVCRDCGIEEVWSAARQKWWYEVAKGPIHSTAVRCRACRKVEQARRVAARKAQQEGFAAKAAKRLAADAGEVSGAARREPTP